MTNRSGDVVALTPGAVELGKAWMEAFEDSPHDPEGSEYFQGVQNCLERELMGASPEGLDEVVKQAYGWMVKQNQHEAAIEFIHAVLPQFESLTEEEVETPNTAFLVALPIIGNAEYAQSIAEQTPRLAFEDDLIRAGVLPSGTKVKWMTRPVSLHEARSWLADTRRLLLMQALEGENVDTLLPATPRFGVDRAELSMVVGVAVCPDDKVEEVSGDPGFLYSNPEDCMAFSQGVDGTSEEAVIARRMQVMAQASEAMTDKIIRAGIPDTAIEEPGIIAEALCTLAGWSLRLQQLQEAQLLGWSEDTLDAMLSDTQAHIAIDLASSAAHVALVVQGKIMGPYATDLPWSSLPPVLIAEALQQRGMVEDAQSVQWHAGVQEMWSALKPERARCKMH